MFKAYLVTNIAIIAAGLIVAGITSAWVTCAYFMLAGIGVATGICIVHNAAKKHRWFNLFLGISFGLGSLIFAGLAAAAAVTNGSIIISGFSEFLPYGGMILAGIGLVNALIDSCRDAFKDEGKEYSSSFYAFLSAIGTLGILVIYKVLGSLDSPPNWLPILPYIALASAAFFVFTTLKASATKSETSVFPASSSDQAATETLNKKSETSVSSAPTRSLAQARVCPDKKNETSVSSALSSHQAHVEPNRKNEASASSVSSLGQANNENCADIFSSQLIVATSASTNTNKQIDDDEDKNKDTDTDSDDDENRSKCFLQ